MDKNTEEKKYIKNKLPHSEVFPLHIQKLLLSTLDALDSNQLKLLVKILKEEEIALTKSK